MSPFIADSALVGLKEGVKLASIWLIFWSVAFSAQRGQEDSGEGGGGGVWLMKPFFAGLGAASLLIFLSFFIPPSLGFKDFVSKLIGYVFFLFFTASLAALYQSGGLNLFGPLKGWVLGKRWVAGISVFAATAVYFTPDIIGSSMFVREIGAMKGSYGASSISALAGFAAPVLAVFFYLRSRGAGSFALRVSRFFGAAQFLLFLSVVKLVGGGIRGFAELSLIPSVQRGVMKFVHDAMHQVLVFMIVPDHPILQTTVWNFIGIFFGPNFAMAAVLLILLSPMFIFLYHSLLAPLPEPVGPVGAGELTGAGRRAIRAAVRSVRRARAVPAAIFIAVVLVMWFAGRGQEGIKLYNPAPKPVIADKGIIIIPLTDPTMDLMDGRLHKFSLYEGRADGEDIPLMAVLRPDGKLSVTLDACEVCPPDGYAQSGDSLVCLYCGTPITLQTLGRRGGCNPVPIDALVTDRDVRLDESEVREKWKALIEGKTKGEVR